MELYGNAVCVTYEDMAGLINPGTLYSMLYRHPELYARKASGQTGTALIRYDSLPAKYKAMITEKYGNPEELLRKEREEEPMEMDEGAREFFERYRYDKNGEEVSLPERLKREYAVNASALNRLLGIVNGRKAMRNALGGSAAGLWETVTAENERLRRIYGHTLPSNAARLREKANEYAREGYAALVSGKLGNGSTLKITREAGERIVALKRSVVPVYTDSQIFEEYNAIAAEKGWKPLKSIQSLRQFLSRPDIEPLWYDAVHGELASAQRYSRKNRTSLPTMRDSLWYGDGTKLNLYYRKQGKDGKWQLGTMQVYEVMDAYSEMLLGYYISDTEDFTAQYNAYRMAMQTSGHRPYELVHDNQGGHKKLDSKNFFDRICRVHRTTAPYSGQSKTIESVFGRFQAQVLHRDWRFTGQNITARKASSRPNLERIMANMDSLYTLSELKEAYAKAREAWNGMAHPATGVSRREMYLSSANPETPEVTVMDMVDLFWIWTDRPSTYTASGLKITVKGRSYAYEVFEEEGVPSHEFLRKNFGQKFWVKYDPYDFGSVRLYKEDRSGERRYVCSAEPYMVVHRNIQEQKEGEMAFIRSQIEANGQDRIERQAAARGIEQKYGVEPERHGLRRAKMKGMPDAAEREVERRLKKYGGTPAQDCGFGQAVKFMTNVTDDQVDDKGDIMEIPLRRIVGKL